MNKKSINILMVDDNEDDILLTKTIIGKYDKRFKIDSASCGEECLNKLRNKKYHVLLLDYNLPGMDGVGVLAAVVKAGHDIPIIMVTGQGNEKIAVKSMKKGAYDYIIKSKDYLKILPVVIQKVIEKFDLDKMKVKLEKETLDKKSKLEATLNSTSDGILMVSYTPDDGNYISITNKRLGEIFGVDFDKVDKEEKTIESINSYMDSIWGYSKKTKKKFLELYEDKAVEKVDIVENLKTGKQVVERYTGPVYDENRNIIGRIWSCRDVTERVELEKRLKRLSVTDSLTKLYNQGYFYETLEKEVERAKRQSNKLSLILFDIDNFKTYNDSHGHQRGDKVIEKVGSIVLSFIRENVDTAFRYGGDEFTVILPDANIVQTAAVAERIRQSFKQCNHSTLSLGLIELRPHYTVDELVRYADKAMYTAKKSGGDRVYIYE